MDSDVASTARVTAAFRALETSRADPLVRDPWAAALAGAELVASFAAQPPDVQARAASYTVIRTRVFDDWLGSAGDCSQVVLLGAGFDTRAFRLGWRTGTRLWELDQATVLDPKEAVLREVRASARCTRHAVTGDLTADSWPPALSAAGFRPEVPTAWLAEGILPYLEPDAVEVLLGHVSALSAPGSRLAADFVSAGMMAARNAYMAAEGQRTGSPTSALFRFGANDPVGFLAQHGWRATAIKHPGDENCHFGRWVWPPTTGAGFSFAFAVRPAAAPSRQSGSMMDQRSATLSWTRLPPM